MPSSVRSLESLHGGVEKETRNQSRLNDGAEEFLGPPQFHISSLWRPPVLNHINGKSYTLPIFTLSNPYSRNFHLSWLGFFVAFLSWFAFPPLIPEAIKSDLALSTAQINNSNIVALCATLVVRWVVGPLIDRFGPRYVMAALLIVGAIPSGLAGTISSANGLYAVRFFIGILGGTFVPCQAWTTAWFDKSIVGRANALVGGWGNMGGGVTFAVMVALYQRLISSGLSQHSAWRASFAIVPVPALLLVSILTLVFGTDHPAGKWSQRHQIPAAAVVRRLDNHSGHPKITDRETADPGNEDANVSEEKASKMIEELLSETDVAINEALTVTAALQIISSPLTWLPAFSYMASFGLELAVDSNLTSVLYSLFHARDSAFGQTTAGYYTALFGLLNIFTRPLGGYLADAIYKTHGVPGKKWLTLGLSFFMGVVSIGLGRYIEKHVQAQSPPSLAVIMILLTIIAIFCEMANGANFALVPHCNAYSNGVMSGIVGGMGNLGGIWFALLFRYQSVPIGKAFWIMGVVCMIFNLMVAWIPTPKW